MRCTSPLTVGFQSDGKTLCWSPKNYSKEYAPFQLPCGKCIACRLEKARQTAIRCVHEAKMYEQNTFVTLTYSDENLKSERLCYPDFQKFIKRLRSHIYESHKGLLVKKEDYENIKIGVLVTGEYGDKKKRPHWHAIIFNYDWPDKIQVGKTELGDPVFNSKILESLWPYGRCESGTVTFKSASYVARYATKKLYHGKDGTHDFEPISKRSSKNAIGKRFIEKFWPDVFTHGYIVLDDGTQCGIPRYYEDWLKKHKPEEWLRYITKIKTKIIKEATDKEKKTSLEEKKINLKRQGLKGLQIRRNEVRRKILEKKQKENQQYLKL